MYFKQIITLCHLAKQSEKEESLRAHPSSLSGKNCERSWQSF